MRVRAAMLAAWVAHATPAAAQPGELTPDVSQRLLVEVRSTFLNSRRQPEPALPASGIIFGQRGDTLYIVTSRHQIDSAASVEVRLVPQGPLFQANVLFQHPRLDLAVLGITGHDTVASWILPRRVLSRSHGLADHGDRVFALGCPDGQCWTAPEAAQFRGYGGAGILFRTYYIRPGTSGGPLVDADGALLGLIVKTEVAEGQAIWWYDVEDALKRERYPVNLPVMQGYRVGEVSIRFLGAAFPRSGVNSDGQYLQPGWRAELSLRLAPRLEAAAGLNRVSFAAAPFHDRRATYEEAYAHIYLFSGVRYSLPLTRWSIGKSLPDVASIGFDVLIPLRRDTRVVGFTASDSVDLVRGEYVLVRSVINSRTGISVAARGSYRLAITEQFAVIAAPTLYIMTFEYLESSPFRAFLEIGGDFRLPL